MLVSDFVQIDRPFPAVRDDLATAGPGWLANSAVAAYEEGEQLVLRVFSTVGPVRLSKRVWAELGVPVVRPDRAPQPLCWRASGATGLFPSMEAELDITPMGETLTSISFHGSYVPPLLRWNAEPTGCCSIALPRRASAPSWTGSRAT